MHSVTASTFEIESALACQFDWVFSTASQWSWESETASMNRYGSTRNSKTATH